MSINTTVPIIVFLNVTSDTKHGSGIPCVFQAHSLAHSQRSFSEWPVCEVRFQAHPAVHQECSFMTLIVCQTGLRR